MSDYEPEREPLQMDETPPPPAPGPGPAPSNDPRVVHPPDGTVETRNPDGSIKLAFRNGDSDLSQPRQEVPAP